MKFTYLKAIEHSGSHQLLEVGRKCVRLPEDSMFEGGGTAEVKMLRAYAGPLTPVPKTSAAVASMDLRPYARDKENYESEVMNSMDFINWMYGINWRLARLKNRMETNITLWQFLLELLLSNQYTHIITWTNNDGEFKLLNAEEVARLWGLRKNKHNMNYDKLSRALRYYYDKNIIRKVLGQKFVYRFVSFPEIVKTENKIPFHVKMETIGKVAAPTTTSFRTPTPPQPQPQQAHTGAPFGLHKPEALSPKRHQELMDSRAALWLLGAARHGVPADLVRREPKRSFSDDDDEGTVHDHDEGSCDAPRDLTTNGSKRVKSEPDTSDSCLSPSASSGSGSPAPSLGGGSTGSGTTICIPRPKPKPPPIGPLASLASASSLQTPIVTFAPSPFLQSKTPFFPLPFWSPLPLPSPRGYSAASGGATHFQFPSAHVGLSFPPLSPFLGNPYSPFDPQLFLTPPKSISVLQ